MVIGEFVERYNVIGVSKNLASCHSRKPVSPMSSNRPPDAQIRVQTTGAATRTLTSRLTIAG